MKRLLASAALGALFLGAAAPAQAIDLTDLSTEERAAFRAEIRAYLMDNPEVIMEAVAVLEDRQAAQQAADDKTLISVNADDLFNDPASWVGGNPDGDITMVEFVDYRCGYCRKAHDEVAKLIENDGNIRLIVKEFPILGDASVMSSRFAIATRLVAGDDAYKQAHDALIKFKGKIGKQSLSRLADGLGLDANAIIDKMDSDEVDAVIAANHSLGGRMQISGTPSFVVQDELLRGYLPYAQMRALVAQLREQ